MDQLAWLLLAMLVGVTLRSLWFSIYRGKHVSWVSTAGLGLGLLGLTAGWQWVLLPMILAMCVGEFLHQAWL